MFMVAALLLLFAQSEADVRWRAEATRVEFRKAEEAEQTGQFDIALRICWKILDDPVLDPDRYKKLSEAHGCARTARARAKHLLPWILESGGIYDQAIAAYRSYAQGPLTTGFCGNALAEEEAYVELGLARCFERLGRPSAAIPHYFRVEEIGLLLKDPWTSIHLVDLYQAANQIADLERELERRDDEFARKRDPAVVARMSDRLKAWRPSWRIRQVLANRAAEKAGRWDELFAVLQGTPEESWAPGLDAAHCLARHPESMDRQTPRRQEWRDYIAGVADQSIPPRRNPGPAFPSIPR